jgi:hypothetical protein
MVYVAAGLEEVEKSWFVFCLFIYLFMPGSSGVARFFGARSKWSQWPPLTEILKTSKYLFSVLSDRSLSETGVKLLLLLWLHGPFSLTLASLLIAVHLFLSYAFILHRLIPRAFISSSTSSSHLNFCLPGVKLVELCYACAWLYWAA